MPKLRPTLHHHCKGTPIIRLYRLPMSNLKTNPIERCIHPWEIMIEQVSHILLTWRIGFFWKIDFFWWPKNIRCHFVRFGGWFFRDTKYVTWTTTWWFKHSAKEGQKQRDLLTQRTGHFISINFCSILNIKIISTKANTQRQYELLF